MTTYYIFVSVMDVRLTMPHPTHIHGHTPQVAKLAWGKYDDKMRMTDVNRDTYCESPICVNGTWWTDPSWNGDNIPGLMGPYAVKKDSLFIGSGSYVVWRFRADNPGKKQIRLTNGTQLTHTILYANQQLFAVIFTLPMYKNRPRSY